MVKYVCTECSTAQYSSNRQLEGDPCINCGSTSTVLVPWDKIKEED